MSATDAFSRIATFLDDKAKGVPPSAARFDEEFDNVIGALNDLNTRLDAITRVGFFDLTDAPARPFGDAILGIRDGAFAFVDPKIVPEITNDDASITLRGAQATITANGRPTVQVADTGVTISGNHTVNGDQHIQGSIGIPGLTIQRQINTHAIISTGHPIEFAGAYVGFGTAPESPVHINGTTTIENGVGEDQALLVFKADRAKHFTVSADGLGTRGLSLSNERGVIARFNDDGVEIKHGLKVGDVLPMVLTNDAISLPGRASLAVRTNNETRLHVDFSGNIAVGSSPMRARLGVCGKEGVTAIQVTDGVNEVMSVGHKGAVYARGMGYAEVRLRSLMVPHLVHGQICGIDDLGHLTDRFDDAKMFTVINENPSFIGGDLHPDEGYLVAVSGTAEINIDTDAEIGEYVMASRNDDGSIGFYTSDVIGIVSPPIGRIINSYCDRIVVKLF